MYNVGKVPKIDEPQKMLSLEPDLVEIMGKSRYERKAVKASYKFSQLSYVF